MSDDPQSSEPFAETHDLPEEAISQPELIFGLVGPIGVELGGVVNALIARLRNVNYKSVEIHLTDHMITDKISRIIDNTTYYHRYMSLIDYANQFRTMAQSAAAMAGLAISRIRSERAIITGSEVIPAFGTAYIICQFKRPEEIELMRTTYGRKFVQVSVYASPSERQVVLVDKIKHFNISPKDDFDCEKMAIELIKQDYNQKDVLDGQRLSEVFHLADVFVNGLNITSSVPTVERFIDALFGSNHVSPKRDEYGLYAATSAALRSSDLSRQVGAAVFTRHGEVITMGCNEVPKANWGDVLE
jgi:hypothetical protein